MIFILSVVIVLLLLFIWFISVCDNEQDKNMKKLQAKYDKLQQKYEEQTFELKKLKDEDIKRNKELARDFLTDTAFWMRKTFYYASENKRLKNDKHEET